MAEHAVGHADVAEAALRISSHVRETPLIWLDTLGLWVKCEHMQRSGSFKLRGATNALLKLRPRGVVAASSGNHGLAVAVAVRDLGIPAVVVMSDDASPHKKAAVVAAGAEVVIARRGTAARNTAAELLADERGLQLIPPYDHPLVIAGQGTVGVEILRQLPTVTTVIVPVGGGGLISGIAAAARTGAPATAIVGAEPEAANDTARSLAAGRRVSIEPPLTVCDGAGAQAPGVLTFPLIRDFVDRVLTVSDATVLATLRLLAEAGLFVEPTAALGVAVALEHALPGAVCVLTGRNVSLADHARLCGGEGVAAAAASLAAGRGV